MAQLTADALAQAEEAAKAELKAEGKARTNLGQNFTW